MSAIERFDRPDREVFTRDVLGPERPAVLTGVMDDWPALHRWTPDYLKTALGDRRLSVAVSRDGQFRFGPDGHALYGSEFLDAAAFVDHASGAALRDDAVRYAQSMSLARELPQLLPDIRPPVYLEGIQRSTLLWFGQHGATTALHYDRMHNLLGVVTGRKRLILFAPEDLPQLYHCDLKAYGPSVYFSLVDPDRPDFDRFPRYRAARSFEVELGPGEMLFLPAFWWHQVKSTGFHAAVNYWWLPFPRELLDGMNEGIRSLGEAFPQLPPHWQRYIAILCGHFFTSPDREPSSP